MLQSFEARCIRIDQAACFLPGARSISGGSCALEEGITQGDPDWAMNCAHAAQDPRVFTADVLESVMQLVFDTDQISGPSAGLIRDSQTGNSFASLIDASVETSLDRLRSIIENEPELKRIILRCGEPTQADASESDAARLLASWSQTGWADFDERVRKIDEVCQLMGIGLMIRPNAIGMLSDAICTCSWARRSEDMSCSLLLDPIGWLVPSMMRDVDDHLGRIAQFCEECPKVGALLLRSVKLNESGSLEESSIKDGDIDPSLLIKQFSGFIQSGVDVIVLEEADLGYLKV